MKGDLHCHTSYSDGSLSLESLALTAQRAGLDYIAITDHDTIDTFDEIDRLQPNFKIKFIKGVELSAYDYKRNRKVHILCYLPILRELIKEHCEKLSKDRRECALKMAEMVSEIYPLSVDDVLFYARYSKSLYKQHIVHALADRGYTNTIFGELYNKLFDSHTGSCYLSCSAPDVYKVIEMVGKSGGIAILAHPGVYNSYELAEELCEQGLIDGIEVNHSRNKMGDFNRLTKLADKYHLIKTGGSDFHGFYSSKPVQIGSCTTDEENINAIFSKAGFLNTIINK